MTLLLTLNTCLKSEQRDAAMDRAQASGGGGALRLFEVCWCTGDAVDRHAPSARSWARSYGETRSAQGRGNRTGQLCVGMLAQDSHDDGGRGGILRAKWLVRGVAATHVHWGRWSQCSVLVSESFWGQLKCAALPEGSVSMVVEVDSASRGWRRQWRGRSHLCGKDIVLLSLVSHHAVQRLRSVAGGPRTRAGAHGPGTETCNTDCAEQALRGRAWRVSRGVSARVSNSSHRANADSLFADRPPRRPRA